MSDTSDVRLQFSEAGGEKCCTPTFEALHSAHPGPKSGDNKAEWQMEYKFWHYLGTQLTTHTKLKQK